MGYTRPAAGPITSPWGEMRPLSVPAAERDHVHGAVDIAGAVGDPLVAPVAGIVYRFAVYRAQGGPGWSWALREGMHRMLPWGEYTYDIYGGVTVVEGENGMVHLLAHSYMRQLQQETRGLVWSYQEQPSDTRWPTVVWHTFSWPQRVRRGEVVAEMGSAGYSMGPHVHWEIHTGWRLTPHGERPDPERG